MTLIMTIVTMKKKGVRVINKLFYCSDWDIVGVVTKVLDNGCCLLMTTGYEKNNAFMVLTDRWVYIGEV